MTLDTFRLVCPPRYDASGKREADYYPTPAWCVEALLQHAPPPAECSIIEPSAGEGHICRALAAMGRPVRLAVELREECRGALLASRVWDVVEIGDWLEVGPSLVYEEDAIIGNPPYTIALPFVRSCVESRAAYVAMLLPLSFLASAERYRFFRATPVRRLVVLSKRPSFTDDGKTDSTDYAWFVWGQCYAGIQWALPGEVPK